MESQFTAWLEQDQRFANLKDFPALPMQAGDLLCFRIGRVAHHVGLVVRGAHFIHCLYGRRVMLASLADRTFAKRLQAIYRPRLEAVK